jgi:hypothetical protein
VTRSSQIRFGSVTSRTLAGLAGAALLLSLSADGAAAPGATHRDAKNRYQVRVPSDWKQRSVTHSTEREKLLSGWRADHGRVMAVTRVNIRTPRARRGKRAFFDAIEASLKEERPGYKRLYRRKSRVRRVRSLDLVFRHGRGDKREVVAMRMLFFSRYTLMLAISVPAQRWRRERRRTRRVLRSFIPYFKRKG